MHWCAYGLFYFFIFYYFFIFIKTLCDSHLNLQLKKVHWLGHLALVLLLI